MKQDKEFEESLEFLRDRFQELNQDIKLPHSLSADMMRYKLEHIDLLEEKPRRRSHWKAAFGVAACFVFVFASTFSLWKQSSHSAALEAAPVPAAAEAAAVPPLFDASAASAAEAAQDMANEEPAPMLAAAPEGAVAEEVALEDSPTGKATPEKAPATKAAPEEVPAKATPKAAAQERGNMGSADAAAEAAPRTAATQTAYADSYLQVRDTVFRLNGGYDATPGNLGHAQVRTFSAMREPAIDAVKTDGQYLYSYVDQNDANNSPAIYIAQANTMGLTAKISLEEALRAFYVSGNNLVTLSQTEVELPADALPKETVVEKTDDALVKGVPEESHTGGQMADVNMVVKAEIYDITDKSSPRKLHTFTQDGDYAFSQMRGDMLYLVSSREVSPSLAEEGTLMGALVPVVYEGEKARLLPAERIVLAPEGTSASYAVVSAVKVSSGSADTKAVLGGGSDVYLSAENLYIPYDIASEQPGDADTGIVRFAAQGSKLVLKGSARVNGTAENSAAFSESDGNLRVVTTSVAADGNSSNHIFVLNKEMAQIGALENFAPGAYIHTVQYIGKAAYVKTSLEKDPFFAIDLSNPKQPKNRGQLKTLGLSEILCPLEGRLLLGLGQSVDSSGAANGLNLSLFDVGDPLRPKLLYTYKLEDGVSSSDALQDSKAILVDEARGLVALPVFGNGGQSAYAVLSYGMERGFQHLKTLPLNDGERGLFTGETLYLFSQDSIVSYGTDLEQRTSLALK